MTTPNDAAGRDRRATLYLTNGATVATTVSAEDAETLVRAWREHRRGANVTTIFGNPVIHVSLGSVAAITTRAAR